MLFYMLLLLSYVYRSQTNPFIHSHFGINTPILFAPFLGIIHVFHLFVPFITATSWAHLWRQCSEMRAQLQSLSATASAIPSMCVCVFVCVCVCARVRVRVRVFVHLHVRVRVHVRVLVNVRVCMCVYVFVYVCTCI